MTTKSEDKALANLVKALQLPTELRVLKEQIRAVFAADQEGSGLLAATLINFFEQEDLAVFRNRPTLNGRPLIEVLRFSLELIVVRTNERLVHDPDLDRADMDEAKRLLAKL